MARTVPQIAPLEWVHPPQQTRSAKTLERLLGAAEALIVEQGVDRLTVTGVAKRARSSVGSIYARFDDKDALVNCVLERFAEQALATVDAVLAPSRWDEVHATHALESLIAFTIRVFRERRHLIAAFALHARRDDRVFAIGQRLGQHITIRLGDLLAHRGERPDHPRPHVAIGVAVWLVIGALEARCLHAPASSTTTIDIPDGVLAAEVTRMCTRYLGLRGGPRERSA